jgi:hypothetical protein
MQRYVIERDLPGAGNLSPKELKDIARTSNEVLRDMKDIQWEQSFVAGDRIYCVYLAANEQLVRDHAQRGGFPCNAVTRVTSVIDPLTEFA